MITIFLMGVSFILGCFAVAPYSIIYEEKMRKKLEREKLKKEFSQKLRELGY